MKSIYKYLAFIPVIVFGISYFYMSTLEGYQAYGGAMLYIVALGLSAIIILLGIFLAYSARKKGEKVVRILILAMIASIPWLFFLVQWVRAEACFFDALKFLGNCYDSSNLIDYLDDEISEGIQF